MNFLSPQKMFRFMLTIVAISLVIVALVSVALIYMGSTWFITPERRDLESRHHELLAAPAEHGLQIVSHTVETIDGFALQTLLATRATNPGIAARTRRMLARLHRHGVSPQNNPRGTVILLHGHGGRKEDMLSIAQRFVAADYRCIVYDARAHGKSEGRYCTFGSREVNDLSSVLDFYQNQFRSEGSDLGPVGAFGNSLGAAVVLQSLTSEPRIQAAIAVSPFAQLPEIIISSGRKKIHSRIPSSVILATMKLGGLRAGFDPHAIEPIRHVSKSSTPLFLAHGTLDEVIPIAHSQRMADSAGSGSIVWREIHSGYHYNILAEGGDDLYEEMILFLLEHAG
tara:strand:+ start:10490 stop:11509 length:1020 start_codon:yes stop_codon:yes gene_type:complete